MLKFEKKFRIKLPSQPRADVLMFHGIFDVCHPADGEELVKTSNGTKIMLLTLKVW